MILPRFAWKSALARASRLAKASCGMGTLVDIMNDLAQICLEVSISKSLKTGQSLLWNGPLPLKFPLSFLDHCSESSMFLHVGNKGLGHLELTGRSVGICILSQDRRLSDISREANHVEVLVNVIHDL